MGKILQPQVEYIKDVTKQRMENDYNEYSRFLDSSAPIFVTYFNQSIINTTLDNGFGSSYGNVTSDESSKRYNKINNLPLYKVPKSDLDILFEDNRMNISFESEATILPNTIMPIQEDYLLISYMEKTRIFKVTGIETDNIKSNKYFKIKFKFDVDGDNHLKRLTQRTINEFECLFDKIGTQEKCLILNDNIEYLKNLKYLYDEISEEYIDKFYDDLADSFVFNWTNRLILYDPYLTKFISDNKLFEKDYSTKSYHIREKLEPLRGFKRKYLKSIYNLIERKKDFSVYKIKFRTVRIYDLSNFFGSSAYDYCQIDLSSEDELKPLYNIPYMNFGMIKEELPIGESIDCKSLFLNENNMDELDVGVTFLDKQFNLIKCKTDFKYEYPILYYFKEDPQIELFKEIIRNYYNASTKESMTFIIENLSEFVLEYRFDYFLYTPIILFIIKNFINNNIINKEI